MTQFVMTWGMVIAYALLNAFGALILKAYVNHLGPIPFDQWDSTARYFAKLLLSPGVLVGLAAIFLSAGVWIAALSRLDLSLAYPVAVGLNFLFVLGFACLFFREPLTWNKVIGVFGILISLYFLFRK